MKTELIVAPHEFTPGANVIEIWHDHKFLGQVTGADGPGVRIISKHSMVIIDMGGMMIEVEINQ